MIPDILKILFAIIAIISGLTALMLFVVNFEIIIALLTITFGITAIFWTLRARSSLSLGSSLREYTTYFLLCVIFLMLFSVWNVSIFLFDLKGVWILPQYFFVSLTYLVFVFTSYKILYLGKELGFGSQRKVIEQAMNEKKKRKP